MLRANTKTMMWQTPHRCPLKKLNKASIHKALGMYAIAYYKWRKETANGKTTKLFI